MKEKNELPFEQMERDARKLWNQVKDSSDLAQTLIGDVCCHCLALLQHIGKGGHLNKDLQNGRKSKRIKEIS